MIKETVCTPPFGFKGKGRAKAKAKEIVIIAHRQDTTQRSAPARQKENVKARDSKESAARKGIPQRSARKARKEASQKGTETATKGKVKD